LKRALKLLILAAALGQITASVAEQSPGNLNFHLDPKTLSVQAKAEELFLSEQYRRAHIVYLNDLAPIGDKYAQYMIGFMYLSGLGVDPDPVLASAWYRLAAERGGPGEFAKIRDGLLEQLDESERARSEQVYRELRREYSDIAISMREALEEFENMPQISTGSRLGNDSSAITIVDPRPGSTSSVDALVRRAQLRLQRHLDRITETLGIDGIDAKRVTLADLEDLEVQVSEHLR